MDTRKSIRLGQALIITPMVSVTGRSGAEILICRVMGADDGCGQRLTNAFVHVLTFVGKLQVGEFEADLKSSFRTAHLDSEEKYLGSNLYLHARFQLSGMVSLTQLYPRLKIRQKPRDTSRKLLPNVGDKNPHKWYPLAFCNTF